MLITVIVLSVLLGVALALFHAFLKAVVKARLNQNQKHADEIVRVKAAEYEKGWNDCLREWQEHRDKQLKSSYNAGYQDRVDYEDRHKRS